MVHQRQRRGGRRLKQAPLLRSKQVFFSAVLFIGSILVFVHQCIRPLAFLPSDFFTNKSLSFPISLSSAVSLTRRDSSLSKPQNWFANLGYKNLAEPSGEALNIEKTRAVATQRRSTARAAPGRSVLGTSPGQRLLEKVPEGAVPLPSLRAFVQKKGPQSSEYLGYTQGSSWSGSLAKGVLSALPLHWVAEAIHAPPQAAEASNMTEVQGESIFVARRKGSWIGCSRLFHLVCKGVYRAIKVTNAMHVVDVSCERNAEWLPHILQKLRGEFRMIHLTCLVRTQVNDATLKDAFRNVRKLKVLRLNPLTDPLPKDTDMLIAYRFLEDGTLIDAMKFFKNVQASKSVYTLATETYPTARNILAKHKHGKWTLQINTMLAPFSFPQPVYEYENADENPESSRMQISVFKVDQLFTQKSTPSMSELVDPRRRYIRE